MQIDLRHISGSARGVKLAFYCPASRRIIEPIGVMYDVEVINQTESIHVLYLTSCCTYPHDVRSRGSRLARDRNNYICVHRTPADPWK